MWRLRTSAELRGPASWAHLSRPRALPEPAPPSCQEVPPSRPRVRPGQWPAGRHESASSKRLEQGQAQRHLITSPVVTAVTPRASLQLGPPLCSLQKGLPLSGEPWLSCSPCRSAPGAPATQAGSEALLKLHVSYSVGNSAFALSGGVSWVPPLTRGRGCRGSPGSDTLPPLTGRPLKWGQQGPATNSLVLRDFSHANKLLLTWATPQCKATILQDSLWLAAPVLGAEWGSPGLPLWAAPLAP